MDYDVVVAGGGLAGLTAGLYAARYGLRTLVLEHMMPGGQVVNVERIETFPGFADGVSGAELGPIVMEQAEAAGATFVMDTATALEPTGPEQGDGFLVRTADGPDYGTRTVIIATGSSRRELGISGEQEFEGRGVSQCASCDGPFFAGKRVGVIGGGDSALDEAAVLVEVGVKQVLLVHRGTGFSAQQVLVDRVRAMPAITPLLGTELTEIRGSGTVSEVVLRSGDVTSTETVDGVFVFAGQVPNSGWLRGAVDLDAAGHVVTDTLLRTSVPGIFAAGDIRQHSAAQLVSSAGDGATAAVAAAKYLRARSAQPGEPRP
jgi:thioredoxin reductase (NADPH)